MEKRVHKVIESVMLDDEEVRDRLQNSESVVAGGCFDVLHIGHIRFLKAAKELVELTGGLLVVMLEGDEFIEKNKGRKPFHTQDERAEVLAALESVDIVIKLPYLSSHEEYSSIVAKIKPNYIAVTKGDSKMAYKDRHAAELNAKVVSVLENIPNISTSEILRRFNA